MPALEITDLTKDYLVGFWRKRPKRALDHLSLAVEEGEIFGLLGPNGAGKTTTLKLLMRLVYPTSGSAKLLGRPLEDVDVHRRIGFLPEAPYFYDYLTAREFLDYCAQLFGLSREERRRRVAELLERVGLKEAADAALRHFSRGMLQRVGIAQALINDPALIFLDDPMLGLDPVGRREVRDLILELRRQGKTVVFSTHILPDVEALCDRVAILNRGRLHGLGHLDTLLQMKAKAHEVLVGEPSDALAAALQKIAGGVHRAGDKLNATVAPEQLFAAIECVRQNGGRLLAVTPVHTSLEDYFFDTFGTEKVPELEENT
ncbi:MAG TPA: ABC transporter ATP-binding protein [Candidatus Acidoferrales bacterium]|nr:ABC transporter ATP-binding protein [Candidatus Acidoferrales bacterium]